MKNQEFIGEKEIAIKNTLFNIGDIVTIDDIGGVYEGYERAYDKLLVERYNFKNFIKDNKELRFFFNHRKRYAKYWLIADMILHESGCKTIMYLIVNSRLHCGLLIGEEDIQLHRKNPNPTYHPCYWIRH